MYRFDSEPQNILVQDKPDMVFKSTELQQLFLRLEETPVCQM